MKILVLVLLAMLVFSEAKGGGWKLVNESSFISLNSESTIEVKTELQLNSREVRLRHLVIEFCSTECNGEHIQRIDIDYTVTPEGLSTQCWISESSTNEQSRKVIHK